MLFPQQLSSRRSLLNRTRTTISVLIGHIYLHQPSPYQRSTTQSPPQPASTSKKTKKQASPHHRVHTAKNTSKPAAAPQSNASPHDAHTRRPLQLTPLHHANVQHQAPHLYLQLPQSHGVRCEDVLLRRPGDGEEGRGEGERLTGLIKSYVV